MQPNVLLVDDDQDIVDLLSPVLEENGYVVRRAGCGDTAVGILHREHVDVIVSDLLMPNGNGLKVMDTAQALGIPIVVSTGHSTPYHALLPKGAVVLEKPYEVRTLLETLASLVK